MQKEKKTGIKNLFQRIAARHREHSTGFNMIKNLLAKT